MNEKVPVGIYNGECEIDFEAVSVELELWPERQKKVLE